MFSPNFHAIHTRENEDAITRKPDLRPTSTRKPFIDRSVNETPYQKNKIFQSKPSYLTKDTENTKIRTPQKKYPDWLLDTCTYEDVVDAYWDIQPTPNNALREGLMSYFRSQTPPPLTKDVDVFFELPMLNVMSRNNPIDYCKLQEIDDEPPIPLIEIEF